MANPYLPAAKRQAKAVIAPEQLALKQQQARAAQAALRDSQAIQGINSEAARISAGIGPAIQSAYQGASQGIQGLAGGFSSGVGERLAAGEGAGAAMIAGQGMTAPPASGNPQAVQDVLYGLGAFIPGSSLEAQGAAAGRWGAGLGAVQAAVGRDMLSSRQAQATDERQQIGDQQRATAAKMPSLVSEALQGLQGAAIDRQAASLDRQRFSHERSMDRFGQSLDSAQLGLEAAGLGLDRARFAEDVRRTKASEQLEREGLRLSHIEHQAELEADMAAKGSVIDASASRVLGRVVYKDGTEARDAKGRPVPVAKSPDSRSSSTQTPYQRAVTEAKSLLGEPLENDSALSRGRYIAKDGAKGSDVYDSPFPGGKQTTDNPNKAARDGQNMTFVQALNYLVQSRGLKRAQARKALVAAGWKPDGIRPDALKDIQRLLGLR